jgi:hypothetical protein
VNRLVDLHNFVADLDPTFQFDDNPDPHTDTDPDRHQKFKTMPIHRQILPQVLHKLKNRTNFFKTFIHISQRCQFTTFSFSASKVQNNANPQADSTPSFTQAGKQNKFF